MPKKTAKKRPGKTRNSPSGLSQKEQSARFVAKVQELEAAGELNPTAADKKFEKAIHALRVDQRTKSH